MTIQALRVYSHQVVSEITAGISSLLSRLNALVHRIALDIFLHIAISALLWYRYPNVFAIGFAFGFMFDQQVRQIVEKVNTVYKAQWSRLQQILVFGGGSFLAVVHTPVSIIAATCYYSAQCGAAFYQFSLAKCPKINPIDLTSTASEGETLERPLVDVNS